MQRLRWLWGALDDAQRLMIELGAGCLFGGALALGLLYVRELVT